MSACGSMPGGGRMQETHGRGEVLQRVTIAQGGRQRVFDRFGLQRVEHGRPQHGLRDSCRSRIDGRKCLRQRLPGIHEAIAGMGHFGATAPEAQFAERTHPLAIGDRAFEQLQLAGIEIEEPQCERRFVRYRMNHQLAARPVGDLRTQYTGLDLHRHTGRRPFHRGQCSFVLVPHRQVQHQVEPGADPQLFELLRRRRRVPARGRGRAPCRAHPA